MANPHRGSVALQAGDRAFTVSFSVNALCELEDVFGVPPAKVGKLFEDAENTSMKDVRNLVMVALHDHHPEIDVMTAGTIATDAGIQNCMEAIGKAFKLAFPAPEAGSSARPPKAAKRG